MERYATTCQDIGPILCKLNTGSNVVDYKWIKKLVKHFYTMS